MAGAGGGPEHTVWRGGRIKYSGEPPSPSGGGGGAEVAGAGAKKRGYSREPAASAGIRPRRVVGEVPLVLGCFAQSQILPILGNLPPALEEAVDAPLDGQNSRYWNCAFT